MHEELKFNIALAQEKHAEFYNRRVTRGPIFKTGDKVWLSTKNTKTKRPTGKLDYKRLGPFEVIAVIRSRSYKLKLPHTMKIYPVFHVNLLEPYLPDKIKGRKPQPMPPVVIDDHQEFVVESVLDSRIVRNKLQYLIHWKGYTSMDRTWEPEINIKNCAKMISQFHADNPTRPSKNSLQSP